MKIRILHKHMFSYQIINLGQSLKDQKLVKFKVKVIVMVKLIYLINF